MKQIVFILMWAAGMSIADRLATSEAMTGSPLAMFGGMWMVLCLLVREFIDGYQSAKRRAGKGE